MAIGDVVDVFSGANEILMEKANAACLRPSNPPLPPVCVCRTYNRDFFWVFVRLYLVHIFTRGRPRSKYSLERMHFGWREHISRALGPHNSPFP